MARKPKLNRHLGKKSRLVVSDSSITASTDVRNSPYQDRDDPGTMLDATKKSAVAGSIVLEMTGKGRFSAAAAKKQGSSFTEVDGILLVTLTGIILPLPTDVTYIDDPGVLAKPKKKPATKKKPAKKAAKKK